MIEKIRTLLLVVVCVLIVYLLYGMYQKEADDLLAKLTDGRFGKEIEEQIETGVEETDSQEETGEQEETEPELAALPATYDCRNYGKAPEVKNQGEVGVCWAVAASSVLESKLRPEESLVFSADHISLQNGYNQSQDEGGAYLMAMAYLTAWKGPVLEEEDPYGDGYTTEGLSPRKHVQEIQIVGERDDEAMKRLIYENGAVQSSVYMDMQDGQFTSAYYNPVYASYCYTGSEPVNHDLLIIGWDDNYPAENFNAGAMEDGAFICQNSWGNGFGENGVFYISYSDQTIGTNCVAYTKVEATDNYDHIYQSDLCGWIGQMGYERSDCCFANVYTAESDQVLKAIGFYAVGPNTEYEIHVTDAYTGEVSLATAPEVQSGSFLNAGYYTVDLAEPLSVEKGKKFAVIVKIKTPDTKYPVAMEYQADEATNSVDIFDGEGYVSSNGIRWSSMEDEYDGNVCLKAYTDEE